MSIKELSSDRRAAIWVGVLYLIATIAPVSTLGAWGNLIDDPGILILGLAPPVSIESKPTAEKWSPPGPCSNSTLAYSPAGHSIPAP